MQLENDPAISDNARLWRRIHPLWYQVDAVPGKRRLTSAAFDDSPDRSPMSVVLADHPDAPQSDAECLSLFAGYGLAELSAGSARRQNQRVAHTPTRDEPAHGSVIGKKTKSVKNALRDYAVLLIEPIAR